MLEPFKYLVQVHFVVREGDKTVGERLSEPVSVYGTPDELAEWATNVLPTLIAEVEGGDAQRA